MAPAENGMISRPQHPEDGTDDEQDYPYGPQDWDRQNKAQYQQDDSQNNHNSPPLSVVLCQRNTQMCQGSVEPGQKVLAVVVLMARSQIVGVCPGSSRVAAW